MYPNYDPAATISPPQYGAPTRSQPPKSNVGWAVAALIFFWPLAFSAFTHATNVYPLWASGDLAGAQYASERARRLGKTSLIVWAVLCALIVVFYVVVIGWAVSNATDIPVTTYTGPAPTTTRGR
ncbi:CD225/dispanin family protein [Rhodococcus sp. TAF43]|uniref:CD225/dispanin family protein n=1 Tax=Rhodococcus sp. TAF43 TaxID=3237483 RepID=UPI003F9D84BB